MSSEDIALYLYEVGSSQRKLEYCRQILASNPSFTPEAIFSINAVQPRTSISRAEFAELVKSLGVALSPQEAELVFTYFQIDGKNYLTLEEFVSLITPQADPSLKTLINKRRGEGCTLDYALRYSLQKFFGQVVESQVRLELLCKFTFEKQGQDKKIKYKRATAQALREFLAAHGKYPSDAETALILKEVGLNKGDSKRNRLIAEYILAFNDKRKNNQEAPKVFQRELTTMADFKAKYQSTIEHQESIANNKLQSALKPEFSQLFSKATPLQASQQRELEQIAARTTAREFASTISSVSQVQDRIKTLMGSISINRASSKKEEQGEKRQPPQVIGNDVVKTTRQEMKREKQSQNSVPSKSISKRLDFKDKESIIKEIYSNDGRSERRDLTQRDRPKSNYDLETLTDRNKTDRFQQRNKRITEDNFEADSNASSQMQVKRSEKGKYTEAQGKKRIEYLRSLLKQN